MQFIFLGPPGAGKGTQASFLADLWPISHVSTGDILRKAIAGKTSYGLQAQAHMEAGKLVPDLLIMALMREYFGQVDREHPIFVNSLPPCGKSMALHPPAPSPKKGEGEPDSKSFSRLGRRI